MNEETINLFAKQSGGKLFYRIEQIKQKDPSERNNQNHKRTKELFDKAGLSQADHSLWRDTYMLNKMGEIALGQWSILNARNRKIEKELLDEIADNRDQLNWQDISLTWGEAEELAAKEWIKDLTTKKNTETKQPDGYNNQNPLLSYEELKASIKKEDAGVSDGALQKAVHRIVKEATKNLDALPIKMSGCAEEYELVELGPVAGNDKQPVIKTCKYRKRNLP